jgi:hypothetical protein
MKIEGSGSGSPPKCHGSATLVHKRSRDQCKCATRNISITIIWTLLLTICQGEGGIFSYPCLDTTCHRACKQRGRRRPPSVSIQVFSSPHLNYFWCSLQCFRSGSASIRINWGCWKQEGKNNQKKK